MIKPGLTFKPCKYINSAIENYRKGIILMDKKLQVFVSSTFTDLIEERQVAVEAILDAGHIPAGMELFKAGKSQMKTIRKWIDDSDVYLLILGGRYGQIEEDTGLSYTELEYKYALSKKMPVFAIVLEESFLHLKAAANGNEVFERNNKEKYNSFKEFVKTKVVRFAANKDKISTIVHSQLNDLIYDDEYDLQGWIHNTPNNSLYSLKTNTNRTFDKIVPGAKKITIIGKTMVNLYNSYQSDLEESLKSGCEYYVLAYDYDKNAEKRPYSDHSYNNHTTTNEIFIKLQEKFPNFHYKLSDKWPGYGVMLVEYEQKNNNYMQILLYAETMKGLQRPMFKINYGDEWYDKFSGEINHLLSLGKDPS